MNINEACVRAQAALVNVMNDDDVAETWMNVLAASWTDARAQEIVTFVELFRNYECFWRINSPQYSDRNKSPSAMSAIASELNIHFVHFDASVDRTLVCTRKRLF